MAQERTLSAAEFLHNFDRCAERASAGEIVRVTRDGAPLGGFLSPQALEDYKRLKRRERESLVVERLPDDALADIEAAEYDVPPR